MKRMRKKKERAFCLHFEIVSYDTKKRSDISFKIIGFLRKSGGISSLDVRNNTIKNYNHLLSTGKNGALNITAIAADDTGNIWIGTWEDGVFVINPNSDKLIKHIKIKSIINCIIKDNNSNIWISYYQTLSKFNASGKSLKNYNLKTNLSDIILDTKRNKIWIGTSVKSTKLYNFDVKMFDEKKLT